LFVFCVLQLEIKLFNSLLTYLNNLVFQATSEALSSWKRHGQADQGTGTGKEGARTA